mmetsp:Transcript_37794/g.48196  ORF Transcript_37794/g.48196 Transcript_37794/m.48196 type:complete len:84 (+) Transcript_37794:483-734(+)
MTRGIILVGESTVTMTLAKVKKKQANRPRVVVKSVKRQRAKRQLGRKKLQKNQHDILIGHKLCTVLSLQLPEKMRMFYKINNS